MRFLRKSPPKQEPTKEPAPPQLPPLEPYPTSWEEWRDSPRGQAWIAQQMGTERGLRLQAALRLGQEN